MDPHLSEKGLKEGDTAELSTATMSHKGYSSLGLRLRSPASRVAQMRKVWRGSNVGAVLCSPWCALGWKRPQSLQLQGHWG